MIVYMKDFKKFGDSRGGGRPSFGGKPSFNKFGGDRGGSRGGDRPAMMHKATCAECGKTCEVPFRPNGEKPVFCNDCFASKRDGQAGQFDRPTSFSRPEPRHQESRPESRHEPRAEQRPDRRIDDLKQQVESLHAKFDSLMAMMSTAEPMKKASKPTVAKVAPKVVAKAAPKVAAPKKTAPKKVVTKPASAKAPAAKGKK